MQFNAVAEGVEDAACQAVLRRLVALFGLADILQGEQWLVRNNPLPLRKLRLDAATLIPLLLFWLGFTRNRLWRAECLSFAVCCGQGLLTADEAAFAEEGVSSLCEALRPDVIALTDAFDFPDRVLNSALGKEDGNVYEALLTEARASSLNTRPDGSRNTVPSFVEALRPFVNTEVLEPANRGTPPRAAL